MANNFGKTWWGSQWLGALTHIDYSNRLPRGVRYANNGSVREIAFKKNVVTARVQGTRPAPYKESITVPLFEQKNMDKFMDKLLEHPSFISKMLSRELDPGVMPLAEECGLQLFPRRWNDLQMKCSCPDWAVPCKHLAAVIYMIANEIDNNPFIVFSLHGVDLLSELAKRGLTIDTQKTMNVPTLEEVKTGRLQTPKEAKVEVPVAPVEAPKKKRGRPSKAQKEAEAAAAAAAAKAAESVKEAPAQVDVTFPCEEIPYEKKSVDFSRIPDIGEALLSILPSEVTFADSSSFMDRYCNKMHRIGKGAKGTLTKGILPEEVQEIAPRPSYSSYYYYPSKPQPPVKKKAKETVPLTRRTDVMGLEVKPDGTLPFPENYLDDVFNIPIEELDDYSPSVFAMREALFCALHLLAKGAFVPQEVKLENDSYHIRWIPAVLNEQVKTVLRDMEAVIPKGMIKGVDWQGMWLVGDILGRLVKRYCESQEYSDLLDMFFWGKDLSFKAVGQTQRPGGIKAWLDRYYITRTDFIPAIYVDEVLPDGFDDSEGAKAGEFQVSVMIRTPKGQGSEDDVPLRHVLTGKEWEGERFSILKDLTLLGSMVPGLVPYMDGGAKAPIELRGEAFVEFLLSAIPTIGMLGVKIILPKSLGKLIRPKASFRLKTKSQATPGKTSLRLDQLLDFDYQVALGDNTVSADEFCRMMEGADGLVRFKGQYIYADSDDLEKLYKILSSAKAPSAAQLLQAALSGQWEGAAISMTDEVKALIEEFTSTQSIPIPASINATLRPYQERGYSWMWKNMRIGFGSIIADDMGLGKTLQVITLLQKMKDEGMFTKKKGALVVAPTGLILNWKAETARFAPSLDVFIYHGPSRDIEDFKGDVLLTSYGTLRSDVEILRKRKWAILVIDEAQNIKNTATAQTKAVKAIGADTCIAMSGTPVENRLSEFWSIMDFANKGYLGNIKTFNEKFSHPIEVNGDRSVAEHFRQVTAPFMMRRLKTDKSIITDLPDKIEMNEYSDLTPEQAALYERILQESMAAIEGMEGGDGDTLFKRQGLVLQMILYLKQVCDHPTLFSKNGVFDPQLSGKVQMLMGLVERILLGREKMLIFTQYKEMGDLLVRFLSERFPDEGIEFLHGGCTIAKRNEMVRRFQEERDCRILVLSLKAAGTGLNLTAATHVIHFDLWWNPAVEAQATDRAYRIGQKSNVMVHRLICHDTFEERIDKMISDKKYLQEMTVASGESWIGKLSDSELRQLFSLS